MQYELFGIEFEWDDGKAKASELKHGLAFEEAAWTIIEPATAFFDDPDHSAEELRQIAVGFSDRNRVLFVSFTASLCKSSVPERQLPMSNDSSRNASAGESDRDDMRQEYDLNRLAFREQGALFREITARQGYVHLDEEVRAVFKTDRAVNEALRTMMRLSPALRATLEDDGKPKLAPANVVVNDQQ